MKIKLLDKNRILDEMNNLTIMKAVKINIKLILMLLIPITMLPSYIIFCIIEKLFNINNTVFETLTYLSIYLIFILLSFNLVYLIEKSDLSDQLENLKDDLNVLVEENIENIETIRNDDISALGQMIEYYDDLKNDLIQKLEEQREWLQKEYLKNSDILKEDFVDQLMQNGETFYNQVDNKIHQLKRKQEELEE